MKKINRNKSVLLLFFVFATLLVVASCTDTLDGEVKENQKPIVEFVNIPPEGQLFSRNPEVYWIGKDTDGLIDFYRYHVKDQNTVGADPMAYINNLPDNEWINVDVVQTDPDPQTTNIIPLRADTTNPVLNAVPQYVFLQGFDVEGLGSDVVYRLFNRNNNPPETRIRPANIVADTPFVNSVSELGVITGVRLIWEASDEKDYENIGLTPPPFDYEWKLFGPFSRTNVEQFRHLTTDTVIPGLIEVVYVTEDAKVLRVGDTYTRYFNCEDTVVQGTDTLIVPATCSTLIDFDQAFIDTGLTEPPYNVLFTKDSIIDVSNPFIDSMLVRSSSNGVDQWVQDETDTLFNVYAGNTIDTTIEMYFLFWIRSRDDAFVSDLTPEFVSFPVLNPKYERTVAVIDFTVSSPPFPGASRNQNNARNHWHKLIYDWAAEYTANTNYIFPDTFFDTSFFTASDPVNPSLVGKSGIDYISRPFYKALGGIPKRLLLKHKMLILYNANIQNSQFTSGPNITNPEILLAMDAGVNVWLCMRNPFEYSFNTGLASAPIQLTIPQLYTRYFGVTGFVASTWFNTLSTGRNIDDFIGTYSLDESQWPSLKIDSARVINLLNPWNKNDPTKFGLPEVNWAARAFGTEPMYLYKSVYGAEHPVGYRISFDGAPVTHRLESNAFKSVHMNFTLLTIDTTDARLAANSILTWLFDPSLSGETPYEDRNPDAPIQISLDDAKRWHSEMMQQKRLSNGGQ